MQPELPILAFLCSRAGRYVMDIALQHRSVRVAALVQENKYKWERAYESFSDACKSFRQVLAGGIDRCFGYESRCGDGKGRCPIRETYPGLHDGRSDPYARVDSGRDGHLSEIRFGCRYEVYNYRAGGGQLFDSRRARYRS